MQIDHKNQTPAKKRGRGDFNSKYKTYIILKYGKICAKKSFDFSPRQMSYSTILKMYRE